ncbi:MAG: hypothetical protein ACJAZH_001644, partial [Roseivirga sp.]
RNNQLFEERAFITSTQIVEVVFMGKRALAQAIFSA